MTEIDIVPSVDWLEIDEHGLSTKAEPGLVILIDPATNKIADEVTVGGTPCQALGIGDGSVWSCSSTDIVRIDPDSRQVVATFKVNKTYNQGEVPVVGGKAWVLVGDGSTLLGIDLATNAAGPPIALPVRGTELGGGSSGVWVLSSLDDTVIHVDADTGTVLSSTTVSSGPIDVAVDDRQVWVLTSQETVRVDPTTGEILGIVPVGAARTGAFASPTTRYGFATKQRS